MTKLATIERELAEEIVEGLHELPVTITGEDEHTIQLAIKRREGWKLSAVVLSKGSLRRLAIDPLRIIKLDYLVRDILRSVSRRSRYTYPRHFRSRFA